MTTYRFYAVKNGHVSEPADVVDCGDDTDAVQMARAQLDGRDIEVWQASRRVAVVKGGAEKPDDNAPILGAGHL